MTTIETRQEHRPHPRAPMSSATIRDLLPAQLPEVVMPACEARPILKGQTAIVTGASSGIGRSVAQALCAAGANVVVNYIGSDEAAQQAVHEATHCGCAHRGKAIAVAGDVSDESQVRNLFERAIQEFGTVDILVNNAGLQQDAPIESMTLAQWRKVIDVNLTGQFLCAREAVREFKRRGVVPGVSCSAGKIVCVSSVHEVIPWAGHVNYAASKGGVMLLMKSIAQEVAPWRIRVNSICPGAIRTPINREAWETPAAYADLMKLIPYKRIGEPDDVARMAVWLSSDEADYITGTSLFVDGGMTLYPGFETGG
jgi:glucose 1-dehydrogenase